MSYTRPLHTLTRRRRRRRPRKENIVYSFVVNFLGRENDLLLLSLYFC